MSVTVDELITTLTGSGLMAREEVDEFLAGLSEGEKPEDGEQLAKLLYRSEKLTKFQTQCVYQGKTRGLVLGNYVVLDRIGQGGMGHVFKAQHKKMRRVVALKVLPSQVSRQKGAVERFHREVVAAARLTHQNIVTAYDADDADGVHFLVMELVEGVDLSKLVRRKGSLSVAKAIDYVTQAATGLQYAHDQGVVHRDIKPSNLLLDQSGTVKILDMGLARFERELHESTAAQSLTHSGQMMGTLDYMAPEQAMDTHNASAAADIYSLGCTLYYLLTGESVYPGETVAMKIIAHREESVPSLRDRRDDVSPRLEQVFQRMLAKEPEGRQGSMAEVIRELEACRGSGEESHETAAFSLGPTGGDPTVDQSPQDRDMTVASAPPPIPSGSGSSADNWLQAELPEAPTVLRPMSGAGRRKGRKKSQQQLIVFGSIAAAGLVLLILVMFLAFRSSEERKVADVVDSEVAEEIDLLPEVEPKVASAERAEPTAPSRKTLSETSSDPNSLTAEEQAAGFRLLFNGENLDGWKQVGGWIALNGAISRGSGGSALKYEAASLPDDFELRFEWKVAEGSNSGVFYRPATEYQILDNQGISRNPWLNERNPRTSAASIYICMAPSRDATNPTGEWNTGRVICQGTVVQHWLNGEKVIDLDYTDPKWASDIQRFRQYGGDLSARGGYLELQNHGSPVWYRGIKLRELDGSERLDRTPVTPQTIPQEALEPEREFLERRMNRGGQTRNVPQSDHTFDGDFAGTTWKVTDSVGDEYVFMFQSDGVLHYEGERGLRKNGTWRKVGNKVEIETNNGYARFQGTLTGSTISGNGSSKNGTSWTWQAELQ